MGSPVVNSGADLMAMVPADVFSGADAGDTGDTASDAGTEDLGAPGELEGGGDEATEDTEAGSATGDEGADTESDQQTEQTQPDQQQQQEELPEGVTRGKSRDGKPGLFVEDSRWKNIYGNHQMVQQASELLGEPLTVEGIALRNEAFMAQERMFNDITSGDPQSQGAVLNYWLDEMTRAQQDGDVGVDPAVPLARTFYQTIKQRSESGYADLRHSAAVDLITELYEEALSKGDEDLRRSAQQIGRALAGVPKGVTDLAQVRTATQRMGIPFFTADEMQNLRRDGGNSPASQLEAENARLRAQLNGKSGTDQAAQFETWFSNTAKAVQSSILDNAVKPALTSVEAAWKDFPDDYKDLVVDRLHRKVTETIKADTGFTQRINLLNAQAQRATSAQRREAIAKEIQLLYVNRAKMAVEAVKKPILDFAATRLKERSDQNHARKQNAQNRTAPNGTAGTVPRSLTPDNLLKMPGNTYDPKIALKQAQQLIGGR